MSSHVPRTSIRSPSQVHPTPATLQLKNMERLTSDMTLILSAGIELGLQVTDTEVETAKKAGCAKVLKLV